MEATEAPHDTDSSPPLGKPSIDYIEGFRVRVNFTSGFNLYSDNQESYRDSCHTTQSLTEELWDCIEHCTIEVLYDGDWIERSALDNITDEELGFLTIEY